MTRRATSLSMAAVIILPVPYSIVSTYALLRCIVLLYRTSLGMCFSTSRCFSAWPGPLEPGIVRRVSDRTPRAHALLIGLTDGPGGRIQAYDLARASLTTTVASAEA